MCKLFGPLIVIIVGIILKIISDIMKMIEIGLEENGIKINLFAISPNHAINSYKRTIANS